MTNLCYALEARSHLDAAEMRHVCPHVQTRELMNLCSLRLTWGFLRKFVETFQFLLKSKNNGHLIKRPTCVFARGSDWVGNSQPAAQQRAGNPRDNVIAQPNKQPPYTASMKWLLPAEN
jgi:hypothetical protein